MVKKILYLAIFSLVICSSCKSKVGRRIWHRSASNAQTEEDAGVPRDYSVTKANAYNDLFMDSLAFEKYVVSNKLSDTVASNMRDFYNTRNFEYAWFDSKGLNEPALGLRSLYKYETDSVNKQLDQRLDNMLLHETSVSEGDASIVNLELQLTRRFVQFILNAYQGNGINPHDLETFVPIKKLPLFQLADSLLSRKSEDAEKYASINPLYNQLREHLKVYLPIAKNGNWDTLPVSKAKTKYTVGKKFPELIHLKNRLHASGELAVVDTTNAFTTELEDAIKDYQGTHGITPDGKISAVLIKSLNVSATERVKQLVINMERMRWMPTHKEGKLITVNIPEFTLHVTEGDNHVQHMPVVVGKEGHTTVMFSDDLEFVVFSPYWNIPPSIAKNEIMPAVAKNPNYLAEKNMERTSDGGIRQRPGADNSLGRVKFLFPNSFNIYFHDTPAKNLFEKDNRAYSHGCIRLGDPVWMANYLLKDSEWTPDRIEDAMNSGNEKTVKLKHAVPVIITYYTAWVDETNKLNFRQDVYGNDSAVATKMFSN
jgi:murein L,D-transpeptidase YcbB/YkuD